MLFPVLQRFYGGRWGDWDRMPVKMINCYIKMLPVIKAEESLLAYQAAVCGAGPKSKKQAHQMKKTVRDWVRTMGRYSPKAATRKAGSFEDMKAMLAGMGIRVKVAEAKGV